MATNDFTHFLELVSKDPALQAELNATTDAEEFATLAVRLASDTGLNVSIGDVASVMRAEAADMVESVELSDEQLDAVAGGDGTCGGVSCIVTNQVGIQTVACGYNLKLNWKVKY